ncbi:MAG: DUF2071 domain-containing protein [Flavobacteriia bacterium]|nr:DUF2071 domain-containing protein [Flavobacteriia bacterium]
MIKKTFLKAEWRKLILINYSIAPQQLTKFIPAGTEIDLWNGKCYISLVGFMFLKTRVLGIKVPFHSNFEEVNLRFYVKYKENNEWKRGVVFIKELVPKVALTLVANWIYKEHYQTVPMNHDWDSQQDNIVISYNFEIQNQIQSIKVTAKNTLTETIQNSEAAFITEHYWGYTKQNTLTTTAYEVTHPKWQIYPIESFQINVDFGLVYGDDFIFLNDKKIESIYLAEGSEITVKKKQKIISNSQ